MKIYLYFMLFLFINCQSQIVGNNVLSQRKEIQFEDQYHYPFTVSQKDFVIINSQEKMDEIFKIIHQKNKGNRFSPIPTVIKNETYIIIKPHLKNSNDVSIDKISLVRNTLYIKVTEFNNPDFQKTSRVSPNILLKLSGNVNFKNITTQY
ncbi:hypothetical protein [Chryseobacterium scophthalmum]|uniref:Uncharacterized protein n=1 Tax=Chryseobacterium scophthalmum TaxID=59733 RepID=A0A1N6GD41_9FLAO|nr:hypothetical protein [Chryseobacterium scophthalmum]SIO05387.1 hypothetical protein SAMN05421769_2061 [Chryseobacterium scophthalmum]